MSIEKLVDEAIENKIDSLALTDINNSMGIIDFVKTCYEKKIKPIAGIEFRNSNEHLYFGIAKNNEGFRELNEFLSYHNFQKKKLPHVAPFFDNAFIIYPFGKKVVKELKENEFIGIQANETNKLFSSELKKHQSKLIIKQTVNFCNEQDFQVHSHLRAIDNNILLSQLLPEHIAHPQDQILPQSILLNHFKNYPDIIRNTENLMDNCSFEFDFNRSRNKKTYTDSVYNDKILLKKQTLNGMKYRYGEKNELAKNRINHELKIIDMLGFSAYFLITWDIIRFSMSKGFYHVGRGSGANSIVAYCLKITDVDPIELDLYFERFINPKRTSPPDFDIDYSWKDRNNVTKYIFDKYGLEHTALLGVTTTFKSKSILRELGKVYGLPKQEIDSLVENPDNPINQNEYTQNIFNIGKQMANFPNIRSIHAGGIIISEKPLSYYTAVDMPPKGYPTTQWDMYVAEDIGFEKLDILSQRGIGHIRESVEIVHQNQGIDIDVHQVEKFKKDPKIKKLLQTGETNGCFYVESPAMRGLLKKLRCDNYLSLVAASSIIRPGVARSGMMREYIQRFHKPNSFEYIHPVMKEQLSETYGVMVYQEDVLKICHHFAGLDLADADVLRRAMSGKSRSKKEFQLIVDKFFANCKMRGYSYDITKEVWRQIESFAGYSFSKAHSASYAVESYQSLFLKAYFPIEFMVAVINNHGGFYRTWVYFNEAKRWGAEINLPCVNNSNYSTTIIEKNIYIGFVHIANLEYKIGKAIEKERKTNGDFIGLKDFLKRVSCSLEQIIILIKIGSFRFTKHNKTQLLWEVHFLLNKKGSGIKPGLLFYTEEKKFELPILEYNILEDAYDEIEYIGFPVSVSYFDLLKTKFRGEINSSQLAESIGKKVKMLGQLVTIKYVYTKKREIMHFATFIDVQGEFFDTVHFPDSLKNYPFRGNGMYLILGEITHEFDFPSITVEKLAKMPIKSDPRYE
jgi:DNA-directed DNA polymerase III PolC